MIELPAEIADLHELHQTAMGNLAMAEGAYEAAAAALAAASDDERAANKAQEAAETAEYQARRAYVEALRAAGYVQTADGPRPAGEVVGSIRVTPSPELRAAVLAAAGLADQHKRPCGDRDCPVCYPAPGIPLEHHTTWPNPPARCGVDSAGYGGCVREPGHGGLHQDANNYEFRTPAQAADPAAFIPGAGMDPASTEEAPDYARATCGACGHERRQHLGLPPKAACHNVGCDCPDYGRVG